MLPLCQVPYNTHSALSETEIPDHQILNIPALEVNFHRKEEWDQLPMKSNPFADARALQVYYEEFLLHCLHRFLEVSCSYVEISQQDLVDIL